jgi:hypothetical protein
MQIYKIAFEQTDKVYIGVSKNTAKDRLYNHISGTKSLISKARGIGVNDLNIEEFTPPGRPKSHPLLKKVPICLKLPNWIITKLSESTESRAKIIEDALIDFYGYKKPDV